MNIPSVRQILHASSRTLFRFPLVHLSAATATVAAVILAEHEDHPGPTILFKILFAAILGISFLAAITLTAEKKKWGRPAFLAGVAGAFILLVVYAVTIPLDLSGAPQFHIVRFVILAAALHLFVAVAPFVGKGQVNGFWQFNKTLCLRFVTSILFSAVLFAGLSLALAALDNLFGVDVPGKRYFELWIVVGGIFTTWFFLAGVPENLDGLDASDQYPKLIEIFAQYILFPLLIVYLLILYTYVGKILVEWSWPRGWVSGLIFGYGATGILLFLLLHPIRERVENSWMRSASRWFYLSMLPLIVMLFLAMYRRLSEYGVTEERYLGVVIAGWIAFITLYFLFSKGKNIKSIPASLCLVALLVSFGPWGAFEVSESSQVERLRILLENNSILHNGKVRKTTEPVSPEDISQISSIVNYLHELHGYDRIQPWFDESLRADSAGATNAFISAELVVVNMLGMEYTRGWLGKGDGTITLNSDREGITNVSGYDYLIPSRDIGAIDLSRSYGAGEVSYRVNPGLDTLTFISAPGGKPADSLRVALRPLVMGLLDEYGKSHEMNIPPERMSVELSSATMKVKLRLQMFQVRRRGDEVKFLSYQTEILYSLMKVR